MKFINTYRFSPVAQKFDLPYDSDLYHFKPQEIPDNEKAYAKFIKDNNIDIDIEWWHKQRDFCLNGYTIPDAIEKGGNAIIDGRDAIWNDAARPIEYYNNNFLFPVIIPPETVYIPDCDLMCPRGSLTITNRHYYYLNFGQIYRDVPGESSKDMGFPDFTDLDFLKFYRVYLQIKFGKDNTEAKSRQLGFSKGFAIGILDYNYLFVRSSKNIIVAGNEDDMSELFKAATEGIDLIKNTQFYKVASTNSLTTHTIIAKNFKSTIQGFTAGSKNAQVLSRLVPYWVIYEEVGKWAKGLVNQVRTFVEPSIMTKGKRTGFQSFIGTGGDMDLGADDMERMHYYGNDKTFLRFKNKFEKEPSEGRTGWFSSKSWFTIVDKNGNSDTEKGLEFVQDVIKNEKDPKEKYIKITQWALYASDAFQISTSGFFGEHKINMLNARLKEIRLNKNLQIERYGILEWIDSNRPWIGVRFIETHEADSFVVIVEEPLKDSDGKNIINLYEVGVDSYDQDESQTSSSKGAAIVTKKHYLDTVGDMDVAMVFERPNAEQGGSEKFYEHCAMLAIYYNKAMITIEYSKIRIIDWLKLSSFESLIALRPIIAFAQIVDNSKGANKYGVDPSMKPHIMAMLSDRFTEQFISNMFITKQIQALAKYRYSKNYNCDITVATAHSYIGAKESSFTVPKSESKIDKHIEKRIYFTTNSNGDIIQVSI